MRWWRTTYALPDRSVGDKSRPDPLDAMTRSGVREVWMLDRTHRIQAHALRANGCEPADASGVLPRFDLGWLATILLHESQSQDVRALRAAMRPAR